MVIRTGLRAMLNDYYSQLNILDAQDETEALQAMRLHRIDLVIMDLQVPNADVIGLIEMVTIKYPQTTILVFSMLPERIYARRVFRAGASGYLPKDSPPIEIKKAFDLALQQKKYLSPVMQEVLSNDTGNNAADNPFDRLSHREFLIVNLLLGGNSITGIAHRLNIRPSTVGTYKTRIFEKLKVNTVFELKEMAVLYDLHPNAV